MRKSSAIASPDFSRKDDPTLCRCDGPPDLIIAVQGCKLYVHSKIMTSMSRVIQRRLADIDPMMGRMLQMTSAPRQPPRRKVAVLALLKAIYPPRLLPPPDLLAEVYDIAAEYVMEILISRLKLGVVWSRDLRYLTDLEEGNACWHMVVEAFGELTPDELCKLTGWEELSCDLQTQIVQARGALLETTFNNHQKRQTRHPLSARKSSTAHGLEHDCTNLQRHNGESERDARELETVFAYTWAQHLKKSLLVELEDCCSASGRKKLAWCNALAILDCNGGKVDLEKKLLEFRMRRNVRGEIIQPQPKSVLSERYFPVYVRVLAESPGEQHTEEHKDGLPIKLDVTRFPEELSNSASFRQSGSGGLGVVGLGVAPSPLRVAYASQQTVRGSPLASSGSFSGTMASSPTQSPIWKNRTRARMRPTSAPLYGSQQVRRF